MIQTEQQGYSTGECALTPHFTGSLRVVVTRWTAQLTKTCSVWVQATLNRPVVVCACLHANWKIQFNLKSLALLTSYYTRPLKPCSTFFKQVWEFRVLKILWQNSRVGESYFKILEPKFLLAHSSVEPVHCVTHLFQGSPADSKTFFWH